MESKLELWKGPFTTRSQRHKERLDDGARRCLRRASPRHHGLDPRIYSRKVSIYRTLPWRWMRSPLIDSPELCLPWLRVLSLRLWPRGWLCPSFHRLAKNSKTSSSRNIHLQDSNLACDAQSINVETHPCSASSSTLQRWLTTMDTHVQQLH